MSDCGFCKGRPVNNAASWSDRKLRPPAPCPRCGEVNTRPIVRSEARKLWAQGRTLGEIAEYYGCTLYDLSPWLYREGAEE